MMALQTPNLVEDIEDLIEHFDTSNYPGNLKKTVLLAHWLIFFVFSADHPLYSKDRANHLFLVKDEAQGEPITRFIGRFAVTFFPRIFLPIPFFFSGLRSKQYAFEISRKDGSRVSKKVCKGIKKNTIKKHLTLKDFWDSLANETVSYKTATTIRAENHELSTRVVRKIATCAFDDKRYLHRDKITTSPLYYHKIQEK